MKSQQFTLEYALYILAIFLALGVRFLNLGEVPLQENEARAALYALNLFREDRAEIVPDLEDPQPGYHALTWLAFEILGDHNAIARLWPALAGALLAVVPFLFRPLLGRPAALALSFMLALDPGMIAAARQADGRMMALGFASFAAGLAYQRRMSWAGVFFGLALLCGPAVIPGLAAPLSAWAISRLLIKLRRAGEAESEGEAEPHRGFPPDRWREFLVPAGLTIFIAGTLFFRYPQGLSNWIAALPAYFQGWAEPSSTPAVRLPVALLVYQPLGVIFGLSGAARGWLRAEPHHRWLGLWSLVSLTLALLYPARQVSDLIWALAPLLALAAIEIGQFLEFDRGDEVVPLGLAALVVLLMIIFWLNLLGLGPISLASQELVLRMVVMAGILALAAISTALIGLGWSWLSAGRGLVWGLCLALGIYGLSNVGEILRRPLDSRQSLWTPSPASGDADLFMQTIADLSTWNTGQVNELDLVVVVDSAALRWSLRNHPNVTYVPESQAESIRGQPSLLVTRQTQPEPNLGADYRGQDFSWWTYPDWPGALPPNLTSWIAFRRAPVRQEQIILWARNDLFPGDIIPEAVDDQAPPYILTPEEFVP